MRVSREELLKQIELDNNTHIMPIEDILLNAIEIAHADAGCVRLEDAIVLCHDGWRLPTIAELNAIRMLPYGSVGGLETIHGGDRGWYWCYDPDGAHVCMKLSTGKVSYDTGAPIPSSVRLVRST